MAAGVPARLTAAQGRRFGLTVGIAFLVLAGIASWRGHPVTFTVLGSLGAVLVLAGLLVPTHLGPVERAWMGLAHLISKVTTPIFMGVVYFLVITPVGALKRLVGRNALHHPDHDGSYFHTRAEGARRSADLRRQF
jgi:hypothetical protein